MSGVKIIFLMIGSLFGFLTIFLVSRRFPLIDCTQRTYCLTEGCTFKTSGKKVFLIHVLIWIQVFWLLGGIVYFESRNAPISQVLSEWKYLLFFIACFFFIIDAILHILLAKTYFYISDQEIRYKFSFRSHSLQITQVSLIEHIDNKYQIKLISGIHLDIPDYNFTFLIDSEKAQNMLLELNTITRKQG